MIGEQTLDAVAQQFLLFGQREVHVGPVRLVGMR
jgi:hypothetical protein